MLTVQEMFREIQDEISAMKSGRLKPEIADRVLKARKLQVQEHGHALSAIGLAIKAHKLQFHVQGIDGVISSGVRIESRKQDEPKKIGNGSKR